MALMAEPEKHSQNVRHLRHELSLVSEVASQFGTEMGGLGRIAGLAFNPYLALTAAVVIGLQMLQAAWKELHDQEVATLSQDRASSIGFIQPNPFEVLFSSQGFRPIGVKNYCSHNMTLGFLLYQTSYCSRKFGRDKHQLSVCVPIRFKGRVFY